MTDDQPKPHGLVGRNCENCGFTAKLRLQPTDISGTLVCIEGPPLMVPSFTPQGVTLTVMQPPVNATLSCWRHKFSHEIPPKTEAEIPGAKGPVIASN